jgi:hypothetical protein
MFTLPPIISTSSQARADLERKSTRLACFPQLPVVQDIPAIDHADIVYGILYIPHKKISSLHRVLPIVHSPRLSS